MHSSKLQMLEEASARGSEKASAFLGFGFYIGKDGLSRDYVLAEKYLRLFVDQASSDNPDYAEAHFFLGCIYRSGEAGKKDIKKALHHFKISAEHNHPIAEYYYNKLTAKQDDRRLKWIVMPLILFVIAGFATLSSFCGFNRTLGGILSAVIAITISVVYILRAKQSRLNIPQKNLAE